MCSNTYSIKTTIRSNDCPIQAPLIHVHAEFSEIVVSIQVLLRTEP
jgi:hypothetical protein